MNEQRRAVRTSVALDEHRQPAAETPNGQAAVDRALTGGAGAPWEQPSPELRARVMELVSRTQTTPIPLELPRVRPTPWRSIAAAALALAAGASVLLVDRIHTHRQEPGPAIVIEPRVTSQAPTARRPVFVPAPYDLGELPRRSERALTAAVDSPLREEARRIRADTARAIGTVLSRMPVGQ